ncbi:helix-turn-helix domain-containing protein [Burkholderia sp. lig30]|uniref:helix-turn-helix domain-containing protein n=1 Tax=Burkholderia sp. lig30 TaxID=1192124 RepID=UPI000AA4FF89|nr:AraC family transcriptional regulator [Burkholderia sp. lig30]
MRRDLLALIATRLDAIRPPAGAQRRRAASDTETDPSRSSDGAGDLVRHQDTVCPDRRRQYRLDNNRTPFLKPFIQDIRLSTCVVCNCRQTHELESEPVRPNDTMPTRPSNDRNACESVPVESPAIRIPLNEWPMSEKMRHVAEWIANNFAHPLKVQQAADVVAMSERTLLRNFTREIGMTPSAYLLHVRLAHACSMLERTTLPADSIARRCGLGSGDHLAHLFRQHFNRTPTEYRRSCSTAGFQPAYRDSAADRRGA